MALDTRFPAGMTSPALFVYKDEIRCFGTRQIAVAWASSP